MMTVPNLLATAARDETVAGTTYHIAGELVPVLQVELGSVPVYFEHHILLWKDPAVEISLKPLKGAVKRVLSGMPVLVTQAKGPGRIAFSRDGAGHVFAMHMKAGEAVVSRRHRFGRIHFQPGEGRRQRPVWRDGLLRRYVQLPARRRRPVAAWIRQRL
jgi:hypothetical protein